MIEKNGVLITRVNNPTAITALIPHAKHIRYKGNELVLIPHRLDESQVLKNLGLNPPSPIRTQYAFEGRYAPYPHQVDTSEFSTLYKRCFILNEMRTGKTASVLWAADYLLKLGAIDEVLVVCPLSVIEVWMKELFSVLPQRAGATIVGTREKKLKILSGTEPFKIINFDGIGALQKQLIAHIGNKRVLIVGDEFATYRTAGTKRYKAFKALITPKVWLWALTGTPTPNAPTDAWGQVKLVNPANVPGSFKLFQEMTMRQVGPYKWVPRANATEIVHRALQPAIRFLRKDVMQSVPPMLEPRPCEMTGEQKIAFDNFKKRMRHEDKESGVDITAANAAVRLLKLQQVCCGVVKDDDGNGVYFDAKPRLELTQEIIEEAGGKAIVFVPFKLSMTQVSAHLTAAGRTNAIVNGDTPKSERDRIFRAFNNNEIDDLVAHPATCGHGLDLTGSPVKRCSTIIWFAPTHSNEHYEQANARIEGPNQTENCGIYHIGCHALEWAIYDVVAKKQSFQGNLLSLYEKIVGA